MSLEDEKKTKTQLLEEIRELRLLLAADRNCSISEHRQAQEALQESEEKYRTLVEKANEAIIIVQDGIFVFANRRMSDLLGVPAGDLEGKAFIDFVWPEDRELVLSNHRKRMTGKAIPDPYDFRVIGGGGRLIWVFLSAAAIQWQGKPATITLLTDITDRKQAEEALQEQEIKLSSIFRAAPVGIGMVTNRVFQEANDMLCQMTGYSRQELLGRNARILYLTQEDYDYVGQEKYRQIDKSGAGTVETRWKRKDGKIIDIILSSTPLDPADRSKGVTFTALDITARKEAERALRGSEERFRALSENAPDIIFTVDLSGTITYVNPSWKRILGYSEEEVLGRYFTDFIREGDRKIYRRQLQSIRDKGKTVNNHIGVVLTKDGTERIFNMNNAFNRNLEGDIISIVGTMKDITELSDMERKLSHAQKMESIGTLAGGIAHDFNNLLMGIQGYTSLALMSLDSSHPNYERLKRIEEQVQSGADLTRQLLGFARGGRYEVKPADMNDIIKKTSSMFGRTKKEFSIHHKFRNDLWYVDVDRGQMEQVLMNLYLNAWQAMPGGGEIYLETENVVLDEKQALSYTVKPGRYIKMSMTDTGTGMDEKTQERIFDPFFTTKEMGRGTGLGLATVYGIIKGHGGIINVFSEPGHGTTFTIYLPASEKEMVKEETAAGTIVRGTETILLVDDEKMILDVNKELLEFMGYRVYAAGSGQEAIALYMEKRNDIDLVILDMIMPGISGGETFDRLHKIDPGVKVLLSSGYTINGQAQEILDRGCKGFLQKPFHPEKFSSKVREMLAGDKSF